MHQLNCGILCSAGQVARHLLKSPIGSRIKMHNGQAVWRRATPNHAIKPTMMERSSEPATSKGQENNHTATSWCISIGMKSQLFWFDRGPGISWDVGLSVLKTGQPQANQKGWSPFLEEAHILSLHLRKMGNPSSLLFLILNITCMHDLH